MKFLWLVEENIYDALKNIPEEELPRIWNELNAWKFPKELISFKPNNWEILCMSDASKFLSPLMTYCERVVGVKKCLRYGGYWKNKSDEEFEYWWKNESFYNPINSSKIIL